MIPVKTAVDPSQNNLDHFYLDLLENQNAGIYRIRVRPTGVWSSIDDPVYAYEYVNDRYCEIMGASRKDLMEHPGRTMEQIHPDDFEEFVRLNEEARVLKKTFLWTGRINSNHETRWIRFESRPRTLADGDTLWTGILTDLTEQKTIQQALSEKASLIQSVSENLSSAMTYQVLSDRHNGRKFTYVSDSVVSFYGCTPAEAMDDSHLIYGRIHPDDQARLLEAENEAERLLTPFRIEARVCHPPGNVRWSYFASSPRLLDDGITCWSGVEIDITERKRMEEALRDKTNLLQNITDHLFDLVSMTTLEGKFTYVSRSHDILGYPPEQLMGTRATDFIHPEDRDFIEQRLRQLLDHPSPEKKDIAAYRFRCADGSYLWLETFGKCLFTEKGIPHALFFSGRDITERRRVEEERLRLRTLEGLGTIAGGIAHDFNNLLTGVFGNIELAQIHLESGHRALAFLRTAHRALENARHLTKRLLTFAKGGHPVLEKVDLRRHIQDTVTFHLAGAKVAAHFDLPEDLWPVKADKGQLVEVIANLTTNAREAMPAGGSLHVQARNVPDVHVPDAPDLHGDCVRLIFRDEGVGIPSGIAERIFEPYFSTKQTGSGLGLAIVHGIIHRHKGHISIESAPDKGAAFTLFLPADVEARSENESEQPIAPERKIHAFGRILLMDDEELVLQTAAHMLERMGYAVESAANGREAIEKYASAMQHGRPFDLTIMDLTVPGGMGGKETIPELLALDPSARVIVSTGYSSDPVLADHRRHGFCGSLSKPFNLKELKEAVSRALKQEPETDKTGLSKPI